MRLVVPAAAIPKAGLVLDVVDDDGRDEEESKEIIGTVRLSADKLLAAAKSGEPLTEHDSGAETIEVLVSSVEPKTRTKSTTLNVHDGLVAVGDDFEVAAGEVVEIQAHGAYELAPRTEPVTAAGFQGGGSTYADEPFKSGPSGAALVRIGKRRLMKGFLVTPCATFISPYEAKLAVGVNNARVEAARGDMMFDATIRPATEAEWKAGAAHACKPAAESTASNDLAPRANIAADRLRQMGDQLAAAVLGRLHSTGKRPALKTVDARAGPTGVVVSIATDWRGGVLGSPYITVVRWEFNERRHISTVVPQDNAAIRISPDALKALNSYLETQLYPLVMKQQ